MLLTELEMDDVAALYDIGFTLLSVFTSRFDWRHWFGTITEVVKILIGNDLRFNEATFEITMDDPSSLRSESAFLNDPAADFLFTS